MYVILSYKISLVRRPRERKSRERELLNSSSACAVTCCWTYFDVEIAIRWPNWKKPGVAFIASLIDTSKKHPFFV